MQEQQRVERRQHRNGRSHDQVYQDYGAALVSPQKISDIHIVFVNYLMGDLLLKALQSLQEDIKDCTYDITVTVVDNSNNQDGIREKLVLACPQVKYINTKKNVGFGKGCTIGFQNEEARYYFALNCDTLFIKNSRTVEQIIRFLDNNPSIGCIGPKILNLDGTLQYSCYHFDLFSILVKSLRQTSLSKRNKKVNECISKLLMHDFDHEETRPVDWVLGAAMIVRREVIDEVGCFDSRYFLYLEDCDWCRMMWERGWPVYYVHNIQILHLYRRDSARIQGVIKSLFTNHLARIHLTSWVRYLWKWRGKHRSYTDKGYKIMNV
jgi:N-acetylglucosaminyl-diphospho-decaprenol L-rhamnosyltransferase